MATNAGLKAQPSGTLRTTGAPLGPVHLELQPLFEEAFDARHHTLTRAQTANGDVAGCGVMYFEDLATDMSATVSKLITERDVETFAAVSTDTNPIHLSDEFAAGTRFKRRIAHGLLTASLISAVLGTKLPGPGAIYVSQNLKFTAPVYLGDVVTATVTLVTLDSLHRLARFDCVCHVGHKMVVSGDAVLYVPNRPAELAARTRSLDRQAMVPLHPEDAEHYRVNNLYWLAPESHRSKLSDRHELPHSGNYLRAR